MNKIDQNYMYLIDSINNEYKTNWFREDLDKFGSVPAWVDVYFRIYAELADE